LPAGRFIDFGGAVLPHPAPGMKHLQSGMHILPLEASHLPKGVKNLSKGTHPFRF
jgi:hypothetical protein